MPRFSFSSLRVRLLLLVLLAVIPALGLILYTASEQRRLAAAQVQENALRLARLVASDHERLIEGARQLLAALSQLPAVRGGNPAACSRLLANLLRQYPLYANFGVAGPNGDIVCSTLPFTGPVNVADRAWFQRAVQTHTFAVGEYQIGRITKKASVNFGYPVLDEMGRVRAVVFAALDLAWLNQFTAEAQLPPGATLTVIDRNGTILVHYPDPEQWVGKAMPEAPMMKAVLAQHEGVVEAPGLDGTSRLFAFTPLRGAPEAGYVYVSIGIPKTAAFAQVNRMLARNLALLGLVGVLMLVTTKVFADLFILRPVNALVKATRRLAAGDLSVRTGLPHGQGELGQLAQAFDEMAESLEQLTHQLEAKVEDRTRELHAVNAQLQEALRRVEEVSRHKSEFLANMSHELRTPLNSVLGFSEFLLEQTVGSLNGKQQRYVSHIHTSGKHLLAMINDILDLSKVEAGKLEFRPEPFALKEALEGSLTVVTSLASKKSIALSLEVDERLSTLTADPARFKQILYNLLSNAVKFTPPGGTVTVSARVRSEELGVRGQEQTSHLSPLTSHWVEIAVQDTGIGIKKEDLPKLFQEFVQLEHPLTKQHEGTGLGLALTKKLVEGQGGRIWVESEVGQGSTFTFTLPLH